MMNTDRGKDGRQPEKRETEERQTYIVKKERRKKE